MKKWSDILKNLTLLTQLGLSLVMPLLMCLGLCWWLCDTFRIGGWIYIPGFFFGLGSSGMTAWKFYRFIVNKEKKQEKKEKISFNSH